MDGRRPSAFFLALCLAASPQAWAKWTESPLLPDYLRLHSGGGSGLIALGAGYGFWRDRIEPELMIGMVPEPVGGETIHSISQRTAFTPFRLDLASSLFLFPLSVGYAANAGLGEDFRVLPMGRYRDYYWPSGLYFWFFGGARLRKNFPSQRLLSALSFSVDVGTLGAYLEANLENERIGWFDILSLALSLQAHLGLLSGP